MKRLKDKLNLKKVILTGRLMTEKELNIEIAKSKIYLGIFGTSEKAKRVIASKIYIGLATKKAIITSETRAAKEILTNGQNSILVSCGNEKELAKAILKLNKKTNLKNKLAKQGYIDFKEYYSLKKIGEKTIKLLSNIY